MFNKMKKKILFVLLFFVSFFAFSCNKTDEAYFTTTSVVIENNLEVSLPLSGKASQLIVADPNILEVIDGVIVPLNAGRTTISLSQDELLEVIVKPVIVLDDDVFTNKEYELKIDNYSNDISDYTFTVSDESIAIISDGSTLQTIKAGEFTLTATLKTDSLVTSSVLVTVKNEVPVINISTDVIIVNDVFSLSVSNYSDQFTYTTDKPEVLEIVSSSVFALNAGDATITATSKTDPSITGTIKVVVRPLEAVISLDKSVLKENELVTTSIDNYSNKNDFTWEIDNTNVATFDDNYNLVLHQEGVARLTIVNKEYPEITAFLDIKVYSSVPILTAQKTTLEVGSSVRIDILNYLNKEEFTWQVSDEEVIGFENYLAVAKKEGEVTIKVTSKSDPSLSSTIAIKVIPVLPILNSTFSNMRVGDSSYLWIDNIDVVEGEFDDFNFTIDGDSIEIDGNLIKALKLGKSTITATLKTNRIVTSCIEINVNSTSSERTENGTIANGPLLLYTVEEAGRVHAGLMSYVYIDGTTDTDNYSWITSDSLVATVNDNGRIIAISSGVATITAVSKENKEVKGTIKLTVYGEPNVNYVERLLTIALEEEGIREGANNDTKYGAWYNLNYEPWCAMFVSWCCYESGISTQIVPRYCGCTAGMKWFTDRNQFGARGEYTPKAGDIVFFRDLDQVNGSTHTGIVISSDATKVYTIEGNSGDMVRRREYLLTNPYIVGYGIPEYPEYVE